MDKKYLAAAALASLLVACSGEKTVETEETVTEVAPAEEWIDLFDGKSFTGWHKYGGGEVGKAWKIEDGAIYLDAVNKDGWQTGDGGDIVTDEEFENFHLKYDWKIAQNGNSGVIFFINESPEYQYPWQTGPEMQVLDNEGHPDAKIISHRAGDLYDLIVSSEETVKPYGEWNQAEIIADHGKLEFVLNGTTIVSTTMWTPEWEALIAGSKFKDMPGFGKFKKGKIALQDHGDLVYYRNIVLKKL
ncbi:MAG: DUF1080 domain-containing protein [Algoriphagus sp.]|jgi:hypothetical protein|uniref:3-keto-disaccharide hydrolase n=1 Tax=Algoriphagus sp. TaxID=1872435 RepID=UPI0026070039|nr:DUF1080 domain-containing protein [Algoriphagus sp.]MDG1279409.1 DUF1080 domain-containing protein [Algoriphagus sp.]